MRDAPGGLLPNFVRGAAVMRLPVRGVAVLIGIKIFLRLRRDDLLHAANRTVRALIAWSNNHFRAKGSQYALAFVRSAVGQAQRYGIAKSRANHGVSDAGVAAGRVNDGFAGPQRPAGQASLNHAERRAVLHRTTRIEPLRFGTKLNVRKLPTDALQTQQRRVSNALQHGLTNGCLAKRRCAGLCCGHSSGHVSSQD